MIEHLKNQWVGIVAIIVLLVSSLLGGSSVVPSLGGAGDTTSWTNDMVFNQDGHASADFRIESDANTHALFVDSGNDIVTIDGLQTGSLTGCFPTSTTGVLTEAQLMDHSCISITATGAGQGVIALTLPATSTMTTLIANEGECRIWEIDTDDVAAGTTTTMTLGTGWNLVGLDATGAGTGADVIDGNEFGMLKACREDDTDVTGYLYEFIHAD